MKKLLFLLIFSSFLIKGYGQTEIDSIRNTRILFDKATNISYHLVSDGKVALSIERKKGCFSKWKTYGNLLINDVVDEKKGDHVYQYHAPFDFPVGKYRVKLAVYRSNNKGSTHTIKCLSTQFSLKTRVWKNNVYRTETSMSLLRIANAYGARYNTIDTFQLIASIDRPLDYQIVNDNENGFIVIRILPKVTLIDVPVPASDTITRLIAKLAVYKDSVLLSQASDPNKKADLNKDIAANQILLAKTKVMHTIQFYGGKSNISPPSNDASKYLFSIKEDNLVPYTRTLLKLKIIATPLALPFKLRPSFKGYNQINLTTDFSIAYCFGLRWRLGNNSLKKYFASAVVGTGLGDSKYNTLLDDKQDRDAVAFTLSHGILFTFNKINAGVFTGIDFMFGNQNDWMYQGKPWVSLGIGYKFDGD